MAGKTVSTHVDREIADLAERIAELEDRKVSQVAGAALSLYVRLPAEARDALRYIEALGDEKVEEATLQEIASVLVRLEYELATRRLVAEVERDDLGGLGSEEEILEKAVELTRSTLHGAPARVRERLDRLMSDERRTPGDDQAPTDRS